MRSIKKSLKLSERAVKAQSPQQSAAAEIAPSIIITPDGQSGVERRRGSLPLTLWRGGGGMEPKRLDGKGDGPGTCVPAQHKPWHHPNQVLRGWLQSRFIFHFPCPAHKKRKKVISEPKWRRKWSFDYTGQIHHDHFLLSRKSRGGAVVRHGLETPLAKLQPNPGHLLYNKIH